MLRTAIILLLLALSFTPCVAKDTASADSFSALYTQWKQTLSDLREMQEQYQLADDTKKQQLESQYNTRLADAHKLLPQLVRSAEAAYQKEPNKDPALGDFLHTYLHQNVEMDRYRAAWPVAQLLAETNYPDKDVSNFAGISAFAMNDYPAARKYLERAKQAGSLDELGTKFYESLDDYEKLWKEEEAKRAREAQADDLPRVKLETTKGDIVLELFENEAPNTVANFVSLVEKGFYNGTKFHRVLRNFMAQGGDPQGTGSGGPGYHIACECYRPDHRSHFLGSLSMAHAGRDTGGSQFFLTFLPTSHLNGKHTVFGRVIEGFDVLADLRRVEPGQPGADRIVKATVIRKRSHPYEPKRLGPS